MGTYAQRAALTQIVGKTITGVVLTEGTAFPRSQLFLTFSDNTYYELYCVYDEIVGANHLCDGGVDDIKSCTTDRHVSHEVVDTLSGRPSHPPASVEDTLSAEQSIRPRPTPQASSTMPTSFPAGHPTDAANHSSVALGLGTASPFAGLQTTGATRTPLLEQWPVGERLSAPTLDAPEGAPSRQAVSTSAQAGRVIHDVNNALTTIIGYSDLLSVTLPPLPPDHQKAQDYVDLISVASLDAAKMIRRYHDSTHGHEVGWTVAPVRLDQLIGQVISLTRPRWHDQARMSGRTIQIHSEVEALPLIPGDATGFRTMLTNLIHNAADAIERAGVITIRCRRDQDDAVIQVCDTGIGMREDVRLRSTDPYFTTRSPGGTGLGLTIAAEVVARHGGTMSIASTPGAGTTVTLRIPLAPLAMTT